MEHVHLNLCVDNRPGVLARVAMVLHRYNINITYVHLDVENDVATSRMDIGCRIVGHHVELVQRRLSNLINVRSVTSEGNLPRVVCLPHVEETKPG